MNDTRGFTLLELLMVVIIIAILASIALPQYLRTAERARSAEALQVLAAMRSAEMRFKAGSPTAAYSGNAALLDIDVPGVGAGQPAINWTYKTVGTAIGSNSTATRATTLKTIEINLDDGVTCSNDPIYGLPAAFPC